jgi:DNA processing protein
MVLGVGSGSGGEPTPEADPYAPERDAWTVLASVDGLGPIGLAALLAAYGSAKDVLAVAARPGGVDELAATPNTDLGRRAQPILDEVSEAIAAATQRAAQIVGRIRALGVRVVTVEEPAYPARLATIAMPPHVLYVRGPLASLSRERAVAVVGTRRATALGRATAARIAAELTAADATVVSGLAFGIDGVAHEATLRAGGTTVAVIGGGHATPGPVAHLRLAEAILATGGAIVSELAPDIEPSKGTFPRRNRIISGLTEATVVVEAPARSGALITASWALEQGRGCFIVPGTIDSRASAGCLAFLREFPDAAHIVAGVPQLIADLGFVSHGVGPDDALAGATTQGLGRTEALVARRVMDGHATVDELVATTDLPVATVLAALTLLERRGLTSGTFGRYRPTGTLLGEQTAFWERAADDRHAPDGREEPRSEGTARRVTRVPVARSRDAVLP